ncbi:PAPS-dependent sulfotransferase Stf3 [Halomicronema hongdechloris C2206]|uniref:PAPS-dependent sulfotransferase Stf3 n=1 Tax=Halomicronema hongdechloris C2206 TaxID=1641165 RepID=A0A1Z3HSB5_9CYAN|nr:sulfotransferase [Halomicronema hongdechloris]ASC73203.1 PAPS-dependent sulfotransferase Stf3 [Halomicronema hongdechloris C2206]
MGCIFPRHFQRNLEAGLFFDHCSPQQIKGWEWAITHFLDKLQRQHPHQQLLIKNPVYTGRIAQLRRLWPQAKFIHIYRNPYLVFQSTRNFYQKLLQELALQSCDAVPIDQVILSTYPRLMTSLLQDSAALPEHDFVELRFEDFEADPLTHLEHSYSQLQLDGFQQARPHFIAHLKSRQGYRKNRYTFTAETLEQVQTHWQPFLDRWGYQPPAE